MSASQDLRSVRVVWKFEVPMPNATGRSFVDMPALAEVLSVGLQNDVLVVWALVEPQMVVGLRRLIVANTGMTVPGFPIDARFIGTVTTTNGIVWHVWDGDGLAEA
jgi:hypothetical protein